MNNFILPVGLFFSFCAVFLVVFYSFAGAIPPRFPECLDIETAEEMEGMIELTGYFGPSGEVDYGTVALAERAAKALAVIRANELICNEEKADEPN